MEIALSAFLGEIVQRSISFFIDRLSSKEASPGLPSDEALRRKLLRVRIVVEEAEGRQIKNTAMLEQLNLLQVGMYRGYYVLDNSRYRDYQTHNCKHDLGAHVSHHSFALSKFNPAKRVQLGRGGSMGHHGGEKELQQVIGSLEVTITDASEFIMFLKGCPPLYRRPYSTHLVLEKTMFGRHVEMEYIVNFLKTSSVEDFDVLPVVGPVQVGKSTLIEHACADERTRAAFSQIVFFAEDDLDKRIFSSVSDSGRVKHQSDGSGNRDGEILFIVEVNGDVNEATWSSLYSAFGRYAPNGGKVVICSRSDKIERFGTSRALKMEYLSQEAYWYRFRALAFGSKNPDDEPKLASMAMEIAARLTDVFIAGNVTASMLRDNFSVRFWRKALSCATEVSKRNHFKFGAQPSQRRELVHILNGSGDYCIVFNDYQIVSGQDKVPKITFQEIMSGSVAPRGKFDAVAWRSSIPPHYSYIFSCEIHKAPQLDARKKRVYRATVDSNPV